MTLLGSDVALAQSALDVMVGESAQTEHFCPVQYNKCTEWKPTELQFLIKYYYYIYY